MQATINCEEKYPSEIHITVLADNINVEKYKQDCESIGVKPIVLDLELNHGKVLKDVMTSSTILDTDAKVLKRAREIENSLT